MNRRHAQRREKTKKARQKDAMRKDERMPFVGFSNGVFSIFSFFVWRLFLFSPDVISSFHQASFRVAYFHLFTWRLFVLSPGVISSFHMAPFVCLRGVLSLQKDEFAQTGHHIMVNARKECIRKQITSYDDLRTERYIFGNIFAIPKNCFHNFKITFSQLRPAK